MWNIREVMWVLVSFELGLNVTCDMDYHLRGMIWGSSSLRALDVRRVGFMLLIWLRKSDIRKHMTSL